MAETESLMSSDTSAPATPVVTNVDTPKKRKWFLPLGTWLILLISALITALMAWRYGPSAQNIIGWFVLSFIIVTFICVKIDVLSSYNARCFHGLGTYKKYIGIWRILSIFFIGDLYALIAYHTCAT